MKLFSSVVPLNPFKPFGVIPLVPIRPELTF